MEQPNPSGRRSFALFAWGVLAYNILVIVWGAYVRASFSGDGCGNHWPFCNGQIVPQSPALKTVVELTHRIMTGIDTPLILVLCFWAFRGFPRRHAVRNFATFSFVFLFVEALLGAGLVLFRYVAQDASAGRVIYLCLHLTNTLILLSMLTATAWLAHNGQDRARFSLAPRGVKWALPVALVVCLTGGIAALGDTLFPATSLSAGLRQDFSAASNALVRLRVIHPFVAILGAVYLLWAALSQRQRKAAVAVLWITLGQGAIGGLNVTLLAPVWIQLLHLAMADLLWIAVLLLVLDSAEARRPLLSPALVGKCQSEVTDSRGRGPR